MVRISPISKSSTVRESGNNQGNSRVESSLSPHTRIWTTLAEQDFQYLRPQYLLRARPVETDLGRVTVLGSFLQLIQTRP